MTHVTKVFRALAVGSALMSVTLAAPGFTAPRPTDAAFDATAPPAVHEVYSVPSSGQYTLAGRGFGHGHGLSQWGAYGAAKVAGLSSNQILHFYYPHTTLATKSITQTIRVLLTATDAPSKGYVEFDPAAGLTVAPSSAAAQGAAGSQATNAVQPLPEMSTTGQTIDHWRLSKKSGDVALEAHWSGAWHVQTADLGSSAVISDTASLIALVEPNGSATKTIRYRGQVVAELEAGSMEAVDDVLVESYVDAVVPSEMTFSWPAAALQSQAVAARTYAWRAIANPKASWYDLDGDTSDQAYGGFGSEHTKSDNAVHATAGEVAVDATGAPIFAQYGAADGGWTVSGDEPYLPAQRDPYDGAVPNNAHAWSTTLTATAIAAAYPSIGTLQQLVITGRDGHGVWGGRVTSMSIVGSQGSTTVTGAAFQATFGLRSAWFRPTPAPGAPTALAATVTGHSVTLTWQAPSTDSGAAAVTGYKVTLTPGAHTATVADTVMMATFAGITKGSYVAKVVAKSAAGSGPAATAPVTVKGVL